MQTWCRPIQVKNGNWWGGDGGPTVTRALQVRRGAATKAHNIGSEKESPFLLSGDGWMGGRRGPTAVH